MFYKLENMSYQLKLRGSSVVSALASGARGPR